MAESTTNPVSTPGDQQQQQPPSTPIREQSDSSNVNVGQQQQQRQHHQHHHRGGGAGGRTPMAGRTILHPSNNRSSPYRNTNNQQQYQQQHTLGRQQQIQQHQQQNRTPGRPQQQQTTPQPLQLHQSSGIPFGHIPAYLPGSASLVEQLDQRILIVLRDGKHLIGTLSSFDQFSNLILLDAIERRIVIIENKDADEQPPHQSRYRYYYSDIPLGVYIVRGDSMVLAGDIQDDNHQYQYMEKVPMEQLTELGKEAIPPLEWDFDTDLTA